MPDDKENLDATSTDAGDASSDAADASVDTQIDAVLVNVPKYQCESFDPEVFGLRGEMADQVRHVLSGQCEINLPPKVGECAPEAIKVESELVVDGTVLVLEGGFSLHQGQMLYRAVRNSKACLEYPESQITAVGLTFKPTDPTESSMQIRLEDRELTDLVRVHVWTGSGEVISIDGEKIIELMANQQALISSEGEVVEAISFHTGNTPPLQEGMPPDSERKAGVKANEGCSTVPGKNTKGIDGSGLMALLAVLIATDSFRRRLTRMVGL